MKYLQFSMTQITRLEWAIFYVKYKKQQFQIKRQ